MYAGLKVAIHHAGSVPPEGYGGIGRVVYYLCKGLSELGCKVYLLVPPGSHAPGAEVIEIPEERLKKADVNLDNPDISSYLPPDVDIVHMHYLYKRPLNRPLVKTIHGYPLHMDRWWGLGFPEVYDEWCVFLSDAHRRTAQRPTNPFVYNGIDVEDYRFSENKENYLLFLAKVDWSVKGVFYAIDIARSAGIPLIIAGRVEDPGFYRRLKKYLGRDVKFVGEVGGDVKMELLSKAKALLFPTLWPEPFGLAVIEALACGTPVLTTYFGAMPEIVEHGKVGFMHLSLSEVREQIRMLDRIDPYVCRSYVKERFSHRLMAKRYLEIYRKRLAYESGYIQPREGASL